MCDLIVLMALQVSTIHT